MSQGPFFVYVLRCGDASLYTGYTTRLKERVELHQSGKGAKYTRSHLPVRLAAFWQFEDRSTALRTEAWIKRIPKAEKERLVAQPPSAEYFIERLRALDQEKMDHHSRSRSARSE